MKKNEQTKTAKKTYICQHDTRFEWQNKLIEAATKKGAKLTPEEAKNAVGGKLVGRYLYVGENKIPTYNFSFYPGGDNRPEQYTASGHELRYNQYQKVGDALHNKGVVKHDGKKATIVTKKKQTAETATTETAKKLTTARKKATATA